MPRCLNWGIRFPCTEAARCSHGGERNVKKQAERASRHQNQNPSMSYAIGAVAAPGGGVYAGMSLRRVARHIRWSRKERRI
jgi:hypothetical protein